MIIPKTVKAVLRLVNSPNCSCLFIGSYPAKWCLPDIKLFTTPINYIWGLLKKKNVFNLTIGLLMDQYGLTNNGH